MLNYDQYVQQWINKIKGRNKDDEPEQSGGAAATEFLLQPVPIGSINIPLYVFMIIAIIICVVVAIIFSLRDDSGQTEKLLEPSADISPSSGLPTGLEFEELPEGPASIYDFYSLDEDDDYFADIDGNPLYPRF